MKYLCLICAETVLEETAERIWSRHLQEYLEFTDHVKQSGQYVACNHLYPSTCAVTVRVRDGATLLADGPCAATCKELSGYYVIEARDLNEAIRIASCIPGARVGCVEVRPIREEGLLSL
jgi:hypothetical protein